MGNSSINWDQLSRLLSEDADSYLRTETGLSEDADNYLRTETELSEDADKVQSPKHYFQTETWIQLNCIGLSVPHRKHTMSPLRAQYVECYL
jgi:hypothetical protein